MARQAYQFVLPAHRLDVTLLPTNARKVGSPEFQHAAIARLSTEYAARGERALISIAADSGAITVLCLPVGLDPFSHILEMLRQGKLKEGVAFLEALSRDLPDSPEIFYNLGVAYNELKEFDLAVIRLKKATSLAPTNSRAFVALAFAYQHLGRPADSELATARAFELAPEDGYVRQNMGTIALSRGAVQEAISHFREARTSIPENPETAFRLAEALQLSDVPAHREEAHQLRQHIFSRWPQSPYAQRAEEADAQVANTVFRDRAGGMLRWDVISYIEGALKHFESLTLGQQKHLVFEIVQVGQTGLDINNPDSRYKLRSLPEKEFSGLQMAAYMFTGLQLVMPGVDSGLDFSAEYEAVLAMRKKSHP